jgi:hypothetical protein
MNSKEIRRKQDLDGSRTPAVYGGDNFWLSEIAYQLAVFNEREAAEVQRHVLPYKLGKVEYADDIKTPATFGFGGNAIQHQTHCFLCQKPVSHCICHKKE